MVLEKGELLGMRPNHWKVFEYFSEETEEIEGLVYGKLERLLMRRMVGREEGGQSD